MTFGERRKRADSKLILRDFETLESAFLLSAQKLNEKRQVQLKKRVKKVIPELIKAHKEGDSEEVEGILKSLTMPSSKEWRKLLEKLVYSATRAGILRAHLEVERLKELYQFKDYFEVVQEGYDYDVVLPENARNFIKKHAYELGVITEDTVINRIRDELQDGLDNGYTPLEMTQAINAVTDTWVSEWHAQTIARTETGKFYNAGRIASWTEPANEGFVEAMQYDSIIDTRTTGFCRNMDGKIIAITNSAMIAKYTPPNHFQCRATWLPVTRYEEWEDDFTIGVPPDTGFTFESPIPFLTTGQNQPLVQKRKKPETVEAKDIETYADIVQWGLQNNVNVQLDKIPLELAIDIVQNVEKTFLKVPVLKDALRNLKDTPQTGRFGNAYAHAWYTSGGVSFNPNFYKSKEHLEKLYAGDLSSNFTPANTTFSAVAVHELAHIFEYYLMRKGIKTTPTQSDPFGMYAKVIRKNVLKATGIKVKDIRSELSGYAMTNPSEFFAEAFSEWIDSPNPRPLAQAVGAEVMRILKEIEEGTL